MRPNEVNNADHRKLITDALEYLGARQYYTSDESTYHEILPEEQQRLLQKDYDPTAMYVRSRADRLAVHPVPGRTTYFDAKSSRYDGPTPYAFIELVPLMFHEIAAKHGVRCLYIFRRYTGSTFIDYGWWSGLLPRIIDIKFPCDSRRTDASWVNTMASTVFSEVSQSTAPFMRGSGTPYASMYVEDCQPWQQLIDQIVKDGVTVATTEQETMNATSRQQMLLTT